MIVNGHTCKLFKSILNNVQTTGYWGIKTALHHYSNKLYFLSKVNFLLTLYWKAKTGLAM